VSVPAEVSHEIFLMNPEVSSFNSEVESRPIRVVRAVTWFSILVGALSFWMVAGWMAWSYMRP
jgi:hypothetical protein